MLWCYPAAFSAPWSPHHSRCDVVLRVEESHPKCITELSSIGTNYTNMEWGLGIGRVEQVDP